MTTYEIIKRFCDERGLAVTALEQELGFSRGSLGKIKDGRTMSADRAQKLADFFGCSVEYLMTGENPEYYVNPDTAAIAQEIFENRELRTLFDAVRDASPEELEAIKNLYLTMKKPEYDD